MAPRVVPRTHKPSYPGREGRMVCSFSWKLERPEGVVHPILRVADQHLRVLSEEQRVLHSRVARCHRALEHDEVLGLSGAQHRHTRDRTRRIFGGGRVHGVIRADHEYHRIRTSPRSACGWPPGALERDPDGGLKHKAIFRGIEPKEVRFLPKESVRGQHEPRTVSGHVDPHRVAVAHASREQRRRQLVLHLVRDEPAQRTGPVHRVVSALGEP